MLTLTFQNQHFSPNLVFFKCIFRVNQSLFFFAFWSANNKMAPVLKILIICNEDVLDQLILFERLENLFLFAW